MNKVTKDIFSKLLFSTLKHYINFIMIHHLPQRMTTEKVEKLITNLHDKAEYAIHTRNLKQALNHGLVLWISDGLIMD